MQKDITRRNFFSELCSKDTAKMVFGAWSGFSKEVKNEKPISCEEAGLRLGRKSQMKFNSDSRKEG